MKKKIYYLFVIYFLNLAVAESQELKTLKIGDAIPEELWSMPLRVINHPKGAKTITMNEYRNKKLLIVDFWAVWCKPCVAGLDKLAPIYDSLSQDLGVLPVNSFPTTSDEEKFMKDRKWNFPSVADDDKVLYKTAFAPPVGQGIPHYVWIKDGKVFAIPKAKHVSKENIIKAIRGEELRLEMDTTNYYALDYTKPLFVKGNGLTSLYYKNPPHAVISRFIDGYPLGDYLRFIQKRDTTILGIVNKRIEDLLFAAWGPWIFPKLDAKNGIMWVINDSLRNRLFNGPVYDIHQMEENVTALEKWNEQNTYGYNLRFPEKITEKEALYFMQQDLSSFFGTAMNLKFQISPAVKHRYAILKLLGTKEETLAALKHKGTRTGRSITKHKTEYYNGRYKVVFIWHIEDALVGASLTIPNLLDSTGFEEDFFIDFEVPKDIVNDFSKLNAWLKRYGLTVAIRDEFVPVLVVTEKKLDN